MRKGEAIVITGAARGLGAVLTKHFAAAGRPVAMTYRSPESAAALFSDLEALGCRERVLAAPADVRDRAALRALFECTEDIHGGARTLIACAGMNRDKPFLELTDDDWSEVVDSHLTGLFITAQEFLRHLGPRQGSIITLGAGCGVQGRLNGTNFCSAKGGVHAFTKCLAREFAPRVRVNCLIPNAVDTEEVRERYALDTPEGLERVVSSIPMGRLGAHQDVIHMVECMLGAEFTTGQTFYVNGGELMR
ncbi:MAG: SDR family NAD(P)-dependent oxidoreductase [Pseudomonadota bacterium]